VRLIALGVILLYGALLRFHALGVQSLWLDEAVSVLHAKAILQHGYPLLPNGRISWESFPAHYSIAAGMRLFPDVHAGSRFFPALAGTLLIGAVFWLGWQTFRTPWPALLAAFLTACMTYEIAWSRQARLYAFLQLFSVLGVASLCRSLDTKRAIWILLTFVLLALSVFCHRAGYLVGLIYLLALMPVLWRVRGVQHFVRQRPALLTCVVLLAGILVWALFMMPTTFGLRMAFLDVLSARGTNYAGKYLSFLREEMGGMFYLAGAGIVLAMPRHWRRVLPLSVGLLAYFYVLSHRTMLFAFRYVFPLLPFLLLLAAWGIGFPIEWGRNRGRWVRLGAVVGSALLMLVGCWGFRSTLVPQRKYLLGYTEPQPDWRIAYAMILSRHQRMTAAGRVSGPLRVVSALPMFHDIYLGPDVGEKYYLPISHTGYPGEIQWKPPYTTATVVGSLNQMTNLHGYVVLDDLGLRMLANREIWDYLTQRKPNAILPREFNVFIWLIGSP
jgi:hypothetical protein